jgi:uncharacterized protein HemX
MKKTLISLAIVASALAVSIFTSCGPANPKEQADQTQVKKDKEELKIDQRAATAEEWKTFKDESELKIKDNEARIAELKAKIKKSGKELDAVYEKKVDALEQQNRDLKARIDTYEKNGKSDWESFKREFNHDMDELGKALKDLTVDNVK